MSLFGTLNTSYTGLQASQLSTDTIGNNIANAENENYTRQRVDLESKFALNVKGGQVGTGVEASQIIRIHDEFTFRRYVDSSADLEFNQMEQKVLVELSEYFPDVDEAGLERDLVKFFDSWQKLASNPADDAQKIAVAASANQLSLDINNIQNKMETTQSSIDDMLKINIEEVNRLAKNISEINREIARVEAQPYRHANTLRDERDKLEIALSKLIDPTITKTGSKTAMDIDTNIADFSEEYGILVGGFQIVDGVSFHPLKTEKAENSGKGYTSVYFQKSDHSLVDVSKGITGGKIGAMLDLRGKSFSSVTGDAEDGKIQKYKDMLDSLSLGIIQATNTIYAVNSDKEMVSSQIGNTVALNVEERKYAISQIPNDKVDIEVSPGYMKLSTYDINGRFVEDIKVDIDPTVMGLDAIIDKINDTFKGKNIDAKAILEQGTMKILPGEMHSGDKVGAVLIKEDTSLVVEALGITGYKGLDVVDDVDIPFNIENGSFNINVYNEVGEVLATREIIINKNVENPLYSTLNGIVAQINMKNIDDNEDNYFNNDVDDLVYANFSGNKLKIVTKDSNSDIQFNITDKGSGFAGAVGLHKFLDGDSASTIKLKTEFKNDASKINAYGKAVLGDNEVANMMQQLQYDQINFYDKNGKQIANESIMGQYRYTAGTLSADTHSVKLQLESSQALFKSVEKQQQSISSVSIDEELANLIKYQTGYGANAKVLSTVQTMLDSLLGIKQ
ncbi:MAG: flagellar hook-associated protein FlgK [Campylobacterales bacterium]|nr:flagellar hook-associated protein FlgK [Campylobacterales bacterium]